MRNVRALKLSKRGKRERSKPLMLQVITHLSLGGAENVAINIALGLREHYDFMFFLPRGISSDQIGQSMLAALTAHDITAISAPAKSGRASGLLFGGLALRRTLNAVRPDLIHLHTEIPEATFAVASLLSPAIRRRFPVVRTIHNSSLWPEWRSFGVVIEALLPKCHIVGVSRAALRELTQLRLQNGLSRPPNNAMSLIYNGVQLPATGVNRRSSCPRVRVLFAGRLETQKGADLLPSIFAALPSAVAESIQLTIAGDGKYGSFLTSWQRKHEHVCLVPPIPNLPETLSTFDLVLMPSRHEGLGLVAVEALMAGVPVVATRVPGLAEVFPNDYPWLAATPSAKVFARALCKCLSQVNEWQTVISSARAHVQSEFSMSRMLHQYRLLYDKAIAAHGSN